MACDHGLGSDADEALQRLSRNKRLGSNGNILELDSLATTRSSVGTDERRRMTRIYSGFLFCWRYWAGAYKS